MRYCPKCGAGIFNSNLPNCPMCNADLEAELNVESYFSKPALPTLWAKIFCVLLALDALWVAINGIKVINLETVYYLRKYGYLGTYVESMENFLGFGGVIEALASIVAIFGLLTYKKIGPRFTYATHFLFITTNMMYFINMVYEPTYSTIGGIDIIVPIHIAVHSILFIINFIYFRKRKHIYDGVI
ncbi:MAG: hypothetical protein IJX50_02600 [Clostridia bacterium]|nr:hypothetical protein [Clostridia bacterium]